MLLDTCALLWLSQGGGQLSAATCKQINEVPVVYVSAISGFEIGIKVRKGKLTLPVSPVEWFEEIITHHDLHLLPLDLATCLQSTTLPAIHADPCDRFIIATAQIHKLAVITADSIFPQYGVTTLK